MTFFLISVLEDCIVLCYNGFRIEYYLTHMVFALLKIIMELVS